MSADGAKASRRMSDAGARVGIAACGAYVPSGRLALATASGRRADEGAPERSVVGFDEDSVTMAVAAGTDCLAGLERDQVDAVYFASTTSPYAEKMAASIVAKALDLRRDVRAVDFTGSLRAGTSALRSAFDAVTAGSLGKVLVIASDCRLASPRSALERSFGDAAAAMLVASDGAFARLTHDYAVSDEILDVWRGDGERFVQTWEERFVIERGYLPVVREVVGGLLARSGTGPADFAKLALYGPDARSHATAARTLGFSSEQVQAALFGRVGNCGAAFAPLLFVHALESSVAGARLLLAAYGDGADALAFELVADPRAANGRRGVEGALARRRPLRSYDAYLAARNLSPGSADRRAGAGIAATVHHRDRDADIAFRGTRCRHCATIHFPAQRVCYGCGAKDAFDSVRLSDRRGRVLSFTLDSFFPTPEPPLAVATVEVDGGARLLMQVCDASPGELRLDLPLEFVFRKIHEAGGKPNYFWKCTPVRDGETMPTSSSLDRAAVGAGAGEEPGGKASK